MCIGVVVFWLLHLINGMPTVVLNNLLPFEKLYGRQPDYSVLRALVVYVLPILCLQIGLSLIQELLSVCFLGILLEQKAISCLT